MYYLFKYLGWVNIVLLTLIITHFVLRRVNKFRFNNKNKLLRKISLTMSHIHPYLTILLVITAFLHGYNLAGGIRFHSGYIAFAIILLQGGFGIMVKSTKKKPILTVHRSLGLFLAIAVAVHIILMKF